MTPQNESIITGLRRGYGLAMTWTVDDLPHRFEWVEVVPCGCLNREPGGAWTLNLPIYPGHDPRNPPQPEWWLNAKPQTAPCTVSVGSERCPVTDRC